MKNANLKKYLGKANEDYLKLVEKRKKRNRKKGKRRIKMYVKITVDTDNEGLIKDLKEIEQNTEKLVEETIDFWNKFGILPDMYLSARTSNCLYRANYRTLPKIIELVSSGEALTLRNFGKKSLIELLTVLKEKYDTDLFYVYDLEEK